MNETRCEECGAVVEDDYYLCYWCAERERAIEAQIRNMREEEYETDLETLKWTE